MLHAKREKRRNNQLAAIKASAFSFGDTGKPQAVYIHMYARVDAKPSSLHVEAGEGTPEMLCVSEYAEPVKVEASGKASAVQGTVPFGSGPALTLEGRMRGSGSKTKRPSVKKPRSQTRRPRSSSNDVSMNREPWAQAVEEMEVRSRHCDNYYDQCGWAVCYWLEDSGEIGALKFDFMDGPDVYRPDHAYFIGEGVRGFGLASQLGTDFVLLERCTYAQGYQCRLEFHEWDDEEGDTGLISLIPVRYLDPGTAPGDGFDYDAYEGSKESEPPAASDPKSQDDRARSGDSRDSRAKRSAGSDSRTKRTSADNAKDKGGARPDVGVHKRDMGDEGTMASAIRLPTGATGLNVGSGGGEGFLAFLFNSAAEPYIDHVEKISGDVEDSWHVMQWPVMASSPPGINENEAYIKFLGLCVGRIACATAWIESTLASHRVCMHVRVSQVRERTSMRASHRRGMCGRRGGLKGG